MNIEAYSYTVLSAILGILIVFGFLGFLCLFMVLIKAVFDDKPAKIEAALAADAVVSAASESDESRLDNCSSCGLS